MVRIWPPLFDFIIFSAIANCGEVVNQGVVPNIKDVLLVPRHWNTPRNRCARNRDVTKTTLNKCVRFVALCSRGYELWVLRVVLKKLVFEGTEFEEPVFFFHLCKRFCVHRTLAVVTCFIGEVVLATNAVEARVRVFVNKAVVVDRGKKLLHAFVVSWFSGANEVVITDPECVPGFAESCRRGVRPGLWRNAILFCSVSNLLAVFICTGEEFGLVTNKSVPPGHSVSVHRAVGVAYVWCVIDVINRRSDIEASH